MPGGLGLSRRDLLMLVCCAGAPFMIMLDTNIVAVSLPSIARDLHGEFTDVEWVVSAYLLPFAALLMPAGALADRLGRRRILFSGLAIFTLASLACGLAPSLASLNAARALQGVGAALQLSSSLAVIADAFREPTQRARVYAIWATVMGAAPSLGPVTGGAITSYFGWRWAFLINVPIGAVLMALVAVTVRESRDPDSTKLDLPGIAVFGSGLFVVVWALISANRVGWGSDSTLIKLLVGSALLVAFVVVERRQARPMIDLSIFRRLPAVGAAVATLGYASSAQIMMTILPIYLQDAFGQSPAKAGLAMIPFALPLLIGPGIGGKLAARHSSRAIIGIGLSLSAVGNAIAAAAVWLGFGYWGAALGMFVIGSGAGLLNSETTKAQVSSVPPERAGMASGLAATTRFIGIIGGLAGLGAVLVVVCESSLRSLSMALPQSATADFHELTLRIIGGDVDSALSAVPEIARSSFSSAVQTGVTAAFGWALIVATCIAVVSGLVSRRLLGPGENHMEGGTAPQVAGGD